MENVLVSCEDGDPRSGLLELLSQPHQMVLNPSKYTHIQCELLRWLVHQTCGSFENK